MRRLLTLVVLAIGVWGQAASAAEPEQAYNNLSHEYAECAAYFAVVAVAMENSSKPDLAKSYSEVSDIAFAYALTAAEQIGLLQETTEARYEMAIRAMSDRIGGNTSNIAILGRDYAQTCQGAIEDVEGRIQFWLAQ